MKMPPTAERVGKDMTISLARLISMGEGFERGNMWPRR